MSLQKPPSERIASGRRTAEIAENTLKKRKVCCSLPAFYCRHPIATKKQNRKSPRAADHYSAGHGHGAAFGDWNGQFRTALEAAHNSALFPVLAIAPWVSPVGLEYVSSTERGKTHCTRFRRITVTAKFSIFYVSVAHLKWDKFIPLNLSESIAIFCPIMVWFCAFLLHDNQKKSPRSPHRSFGSIPLSHPFPRTSPTPS